MTTGTHIETSAVYVVYTAPDASLEAIRTARELAAELDAAILVLRFRPVPYALPIAAGSHLPDPEFKTLTATLEREGISATMRTYVCRSDEDAAAVALPFRSLVFVGGRRAFWPTRATRWQRALEKLGHSVVLVNPSTRPAAKSPHLQNTKSPHHQMEKLRA